MNFLDLGRDIHSVIGKVYYNLVVTGEHECVCDLAAYSRSSRSLYISCAHLLLEIRNLYSGEYYVRFTHLARKMANDTNGIRARRRRRELIAEFYNMIYHHRHILYARISEHNNEENIYVIICTYERLISDDILFGDMCAHFRGVLIRVRAIVGKEYGRIVAASGRFK